MITNNDELLESQPFFFRFRSMLPMYYRRANAAIIVYDVTSEESFINVTEWVKGNS